MISIIQLHLLYQILIYFIAFDMIWYFMYLRNVRLGFLQVFRFLLSKHATRCRSKRLGCRWIALVRADGAVVWTGFPFSSYFCLLPSDPGIGCGSAVTLTRLKHDDMSTTSARIKLVSFISLTLQQLSFSRRTRVRWGKRVAFQSLI